MELMAGHLSRPAAAGSGVPVRTLPAAPQEGVEAARPRLLEGLSVPGQLLTAPRTHSRPRPPIPALGAPLSGSTPAGSLKSQVPGRICLLTVLCTPARWLGLRSRRLPAASLLDSQLQGGGTPASQPVLRLPPTCPAPPTLTECRPADWRVWARLECAVQRGQCLGHANSRCPISACRVESKGLAVGMCFS